MVTIKRITKSIGWRIIDRSRTRWTMIWLCLLIVLVVTLFSRFWMTDNLEFDEVPTSKYTPELDHEHYYRHWGGNKTDHEWLINHVSTGRSDIPTFVVEEHYEVVKYWFQAAQLGIIPKSGNTLVHIDGHSDDDYPRHTDIIPRFRFPHSEDEVHNMMQSNDQFIVASALAGLIDHDIWVWPMWALDDEQQEENYAHAVYDVQLGFVQKESNSEGSRGYDLCECLKRRQSYEEEGHTRQWNCHRQNDTGEDLADAYVIDRSMCHVQGNYVVEYMSEDLAVEILAKRNWSSESVLLDIDEDFFGCWSDAIPLYEIGVSQDDLDDLSELVTDLFCVSTAQGEQIADRFYFSLLSVITALKSKFCGDDEFESKQCLSNIGQFIVENINNIEHFLKQKGLLQIIMCDSKAEMRHLHLKNLMSFLASFSTHQLMALSNLGICLEESPPFLTFPTTDQFHVCHGNNVPNDTLVVFHMPRKREIILRTLTLGRILSSVGKEPVMISICRSVRDGYTPKQYFDAIEANVMNTIHSVYRMTDSVHVHYDGNLLGGRDGWSSRSQPFGHLLLKALKLS